MTNQTKLKCHHCDAEYFINWDDDDIEPTTCPFCGEDSLIEEEDAVFDNEENEDDWN